MKEVLEFEDIIRRALPYAGDECPVYKDAIAIMQGRPTAATGSRKERLRGIAEQMKVYLPVEKPAETAAPAPEFVPLASRPTFEPSASATRYFDAVEIDHDDDMFDMFDDDPDPNERCSNKGGHEFVTADEDNGGDGRSYCQWCSADGDA